MDILKLGNGVAATSPQARNDEHQAKDQRALTGNRQTYGIIPKQHLWAVDSDQAMRPTPAGDRERLGSRLARLQPGCPSCILASDRLGTKQGNVKAWLSGPRRCRVFNLAEQILRQIKSLPFGGNSIRGELAVVGFGRRSSRTAVRTRWRITRSIRAKRREGHRSPERLPVRRARGLRRRCESSTATFAFASAAGIASRPFARWLHSPRQACLDGRCCATHVDDSSLLTSVTSS